MRGESDERKKKSDWWKKWLANKTFKIVVIAVVVALALGISVGHVLKTESDTTKIGFEDIGELATQSAYCTQVNSIDDYRTLFNAINIPFTQSKYIYSYDVIIKAGYNFEDIKWKEDEGNKRITVDLPAPKILSTQVDFDSFKLYHEDESIFNNVTLKEQNEVNKKMVAEAEQSAVENGLYENAAENAEVILTGFFGNKYNLMNTK